MIINERDSRHEQVLAAARQMMTAARTAPKGKGVDIIEIALIEGEDLTRLSNKMVAMVEEHGMKFFLRDADNVLQAECVMLIGTHTLTQGLNCAHCGYATCAEKPCEVPCAINSIDVGIAIGSACAMAAAAIGEIYEMSINQIEYASEVAIEHHLGLTCDPIRGLVQIPCIERNAVAAMRAINAINLANFLTNTRKISFDVVVQTMYETGRDLSHRYRETSEGGLAKLYE